MTFRIVLRTLTARPVRTLVLSAGFGFGVAVMASLLGVGEVVLEQARSPSLQGGGDLRVLGPTGEVPHARHLIHSILGREPLAGEIRAASPTRTETLFLLDGGEPLAVRARGGIPSLERALEDAETSDADTWRDRPEDRAWSRPDAAGILRAIDAFHRVPSAEGLPWEGSWAEWLYFNVRGEEASFYLTFLVGGRSSAGGREAGVRLQLDRGEGIVTWSAGGEVDAEELLERAPDLAIAGNSVRLDGSTYRIELDLPGGQGRPPVRGRLEMQAPAGASVPPIVLRGADGWRSGYVVPVLDGALNGRLRLGGEELRFHEASGYHDHNWGFWWNVTWRWGQVAAEGLSIVYGKVLAPEEAVDPSRIPGLVAVLAESGPLGFSRAGGVTIRETDGPDDRPTEILVEATGHGMRLILRQEVLSIEASPTTGPMEAGGPAELLQMRARYRVEGVVGGRRLDFTAVGSAETFR